MAERATNYPDIADRSARQLGEVTFPAAQHVVVDSLPGGASSVVDVSDRSGRLVGQVSFGSAQHVIVDSAPAAGADVTDRSARLLGHVTVDNASLAVTGTFWQASQPVTGTFWQATQPVSIALNTPDVTDRSARLLGHVTVDNASLAVTGSFFQATQPISAAALPLPSGAAADATLTGGTQRTKITDGTNNAAVKAASTAAVAGDPAQVVAISPNNSVAVTGTFFQATQPVSGTFWQATQPISAASLPLPIGAAADATLTGGTQQSRITDGTNVATVKAASTQAVAADKALVVAWSPNMGPTNNSLLVSAAASINATVVKASAGRLYKVKGYNAKASVVYIKFWNKATTPAPASDSALIMFSYPLKASDQFDIDLTPIGFAFSTGIGYTISTGSAITDVTAVLAADIVGLNVMYS